jgi:hypothetical protein
MLVKEREMEQEFVRERERKSEEGEELGINSRERVGKDGGDEAREESTKL